MIERLDASGKHLSRCRCEPCHAAHLAHRTLLRHGGGSQTFKHGTINGYHDRGCRCDPCSRAASADARVRAGGTAPKLAVPRYNTQASEVDFGQSRPSRT